LYKSPAPPKKTASTAVLRGVTVGDAERSGVDDICGVDGNEEYGEEYGEDFEEPILRTDPSSSARWETMTPFFLVGSKLL